MTPSEVEYREIPGFPGYTATSNGDIIGKRHTVLKPCANDHGRLCVVFIFGEWGSCRRTTKTLHRMICLAFHGPPPTPAHHARHLDGDYLNNKSDNLAWGTAKDNYQDRLVYGNEPVGARNSNARLATDQVLSIKSRLDKGEPAKAIAADFGVAFQSVYNIKNGLTWKKYLAELTT